MGTILFLAFWAGHADSWAYQSVDSPESSTKSIEEENRDRIEHLAKQADDASKSPEERKALWEEVLRLDSHNLLAVRKLDEIDQEIEKKKQEQEAKDKAAREAEDARQAELEKENSKNSAIDEARSLLRAGKPGAAKQKIAEALAISPLDPQALALQRQIGGQIRRNSVNHWMKVGIVSVFLLGIAGLVVMLLRPRKMFLRVMEGPMTGAIYPLERKRIRVGSSEAHSEIVIDDTDNRISRVHLELIRSGRRFFIRDLSTNGTKHNGRPMIKGKSVRMKPGDVVALADAVTIELCSGKQGR